MSISMKKNFVLYILPSIISKASGIIMLPIFTYYLDPKDYGIVAALTIVIGLMQVLSETGAGWVISANYYKLEMNERKELLFNQAFAEAFLKVFWGVVFWLLARNILPLIIPEYTPKLLYYFNFLLIAFFLGIIDSTVLSTIIIQKKGSFFALVQISSWLCGLLASLYCLVVLKLGILALFVGPVAKGLIAFMLQICYFWKNTSLVFRKRWIKETISTGLPALPKSLSSYIMVVCDKFLIQKWLSLSSLGFYTHSLAYKGIPDMLNKSFNRSFTPEFMEHYSENEGVSRFEKISKHWILLFSAMTLFCIFYSREIINILTHGKFIAAAPLVPLWFFAAFVQSYSMFYSKIILYFKKTKFFLYVSIVATLANISLNIILIPMFGVIGAAAATIIGILLTSFSIFFYAKKLCTVNFVDFSFFFSVGLIVATYVFNIVFTLNIITKTAIFTAAILCNLGVVLLTKTVLNILFSRRKAE